MFIKIIVILRIMKIAMITSYYGSGIGGADISTKLSIEGLIKKNINVHIINLKPTFLKLKRLLLNTNFYDFFIRKQINKQLGNPDIIHVHDLMLLPAATSIAQKNNIPIIADGGIRHSGEHKWSDLS